MNGPPIAQPGGDSMAPVRRRVRFQSRLFTLRENLCQRRGASSAEVMASIAYDEVVLPSKGIWVRHEKDQRWPVVPGSLHYFERGSEHRVSHPRGSADANTGIEFDPLVVDPTRASLNRSDPGERGRARWMSAGARAAHALLDIALAQPTVDALEIDELCARLVEDALASALGDEPEERARAVRSPGQRARHAELAEAVSGYVSAHCQDAPSLGDVAQAVGASPGHVSRVFRAQTGRTIHGHRRALQVAAALRILAKPGADLYDTAAATGFGDRTQLHRAFQAEIGCSPGRAARELASRRGRARLLGHARGS